MTYCLRNEMIHSLKKEVSMFDIIMVEPIGFKVEYAINPHMLDENGKPHTVNQKLAHEQWTKLKEVFEGHKLNVQVIKGDESLPDMVFSANQSFPFLMNNKISFVLSNMNNDERKPEVAHFKKWFKERNIRTHEITNTPFESSGDAIWNPIIPELWGGFGFRTGSDVYDELEKLLDIKINRLELVDERFYHLDTCLSIINEQTAIYTPLGFSSTGIDLLESKFSNLIEVSDSEALNDFACNCFSFNGKDIYIQESAEITIDQINSKGLIAHKIDTSEFIKAGGSVYCMKQFIPRWMR